MPSGARPDRALMPGDARPECALGWGLAGIALVTLWRVALLPFDRADLFVDDAQYWLWGKELAWGYYSKPPLIGWILGLSTGMGGDAPFWIRLPLPLIHAGTAVLVMLIACRLWDARVGAVAGLAWVSLPGVSLGSLLVSTDTPMLFCFALGSLAFLILSEQRSAGWAMTMGAAVGGGLLAKYAMVYFAVTAAVMAAALPAARISWRDAGLAAGVALLVVAPNLAWNRANGFATLQHTADNASWDGPLLRPLALLEFWAGQAAVAGPVILVAWLAALRLARRDARLAWAVALSVPTFAIVSLQALRAGANANWAAAGHVGVVLAGVALLAARPRWLAAGLGLNLAIALALPLAATRADSLRLGDRIVMERYVGRAAVSLRAAEIARAEGLGTIVSDSRDILADLFYTLREEGFRLYARPVEGFPPHHYAQRYPLPPGDGPVLLVTRRGAPPECADGAEPVLVAQWRLEQGYTRAPIYAFRVPRSCWHR
jgi:hypothetical protein